MGRKPKAVFLPCSGKQLWYSEDQEGLHVFLCFCVWMCEHHGEAEWTVCYWGEDRL